MQITLPPEYVEWFRVRKIDVREFIANFMKWYTWDVKIPRHTFHEQKWIAYKRELQTIEFSKQEEVVLAKLLKKIRLKEIVDHEYNWCQIAYEHDHLEKTMKFLIYCTKKTNFNVEFFVNSLGSYIEEVQQHDPNFDPYEFVKHAYYSHNFGYLKDNNQRIMDIQNYEVVS